MRRCSYEPIRPPAPDSYNRRPEEERRKVAVTGSNGFPSDQWNYFCMICDRVTFPLNDPIILVWGWTDRLIDQFAMNWASFNWLTLKVHYTDDRRIPVSVADEKREDRILEATDYMILFQTGVDKRIQRLVAKANDFDVKIKLFQF